MPFPSFHSRQDTPLDGALRQATGRTTAPGWRWYLTSVALFLLSLFPLLIVAGNSPSALFTWPGAIPELLLSLFFLFAWGLFAFRAQPGWVLCVLTIAVLVTLSVAGLLQTLLGGGSVFPYAPRRNPLYWFTAFACVGSLLYFLSHSRVRAPFRIPRSWTNTCITLGGGLGAGLAIWMEWFTPL